MQNVPTGIDPVAGSLSLQDTVQLDRQVHFLARMAVFNGCSQMTLERVIRALRSLSVHTGAVVCREGETADEFYLIESGALSVGVESGGQTREVRRLGPGDCFGEIALLQKGVRTATVRAESNAHLWALSGAQFDALRAEDPALDAALRDIARDRKTGLRMFAFEVEHRNVAALAAAGGELRIGQQPDNDIVFPSRLVSGHHAILQRHGNEFHIRNWGSASRTYVNGIEISGPTILTDGDEIWVGDERLVFDRTAVRRCVEPHGIRIDVADVTKDIKGGKRLLNGISLSILPGEFVAIVGGSGVGKSTFMDAISGVRPATSGRVSYNGRDYYRDMALFRTSLGYVPQDDIIHTELSVRQVLHYAAQLRLPTDMAQEDRDTVVDEVLAELGLAAQADVRVSSLSGGQRKRASIGAELLTRPRVFFLDEPTSGLDPANETQMMQLMRRLADAGSTVVLTTHVTKNIALCDKVIVLTYGGYLAFAGTPARAQRYFKVGTFDDIYSHLDEATPEEWWAQFNRSPDYLALVGDRLPEDAGPPPERRSLAMTARGRGLMNQLGVLVRRNWALFVGNRRDVAMVLAQPIVIPLLMLAVFRTHPFLLNVENPRIPLIILYFLISSGLLFGISNAIREIVKEYAIFRREHMVSISVVPYVLSKALVIAPFLMASEILMVLVLWLAQRMPDRGLSVYAPLLLILWLNVLAAMALGLFVSALVSSSDQASRLVPILLVPQLLFSGAILSIPAMVPAGRWISRVMISKWALDSAGHVADLNGLFKHGTSPIASAMLQDYRDTFSANIWLACGVLSAIVIGLLTLACVALWRKSVER